jgi:hypothetical protein
MTYEDIDEHIERLRGGGTLTENEVKNLCDKVGSSKHCIRNKRKKERMNEYDIK